MTTKKRRNNESRNDRYDGDNNKRFSSLTIITTENVVYFINHNNIYTLLNTTPATATAFVAFFYSDYLKHFVAETNGTTKSFPQNGEQGTTVAFYNKIIKPSDITTRSACCKSANQ